MDKINWAILGPGTIAEDFAKAITEVNGSIYAVGARSLEKAEKFASNYNGV
jgi:predicted dehydrogenase